MFFFARVLIDLEKQRALYDEGKGKVKSYRTGGRVSQDFASLDGPEQFLLHDMRFYWAVAAASGSCNLTALMNMVAAILLDVRSKTIRRATDLKNQPKCTAGMINKM